ncbi:hypothetical protein SCHPADRAFT_941029 [Schizopora paradoxa]|uniref:Prolyl 4-hydroxylase alpha subunit Fe(2+) 2OG dioxygenase domain-containing protein n=1 Tax=Schizopora paradoxa TaxID=27342 RepID=A0A0H2RKZ4_9AGAM|nr:hypothetical protein SCHPADRAFT_941029 [Schizopora paradoxa]
MKVFEEAERNQVTFRSFSVVEELGGKSELPVVGDEAWVLWDDLASRMAVDRDGVPVLYHLPKFLLESDVDKYNAPCIEVGKNLKNNKEDEDKSTFVISAGEISGCIEFSHAETQENGPPTVSSSLDDGIEPLKSLVDETDFLSQRINSMIFFINQIFYDGLERLREIINKCSDTQELAEEDPILMEGRTIAFNQKTPLRFEDGDFAYGWTALVSLGTFTEGGYVKIPRLGLRVRFLPGDVLIFRGTLLEHEMEPWSGGQKICLKHFTKENLWNYANIEL